MTDSIHDLLREAIKQRYGGNMTRMADVFDVPVQSVSKWVAEDERKRTVPGPASCQKIARGLGLDPDYVLQLAGHRSADDASVDLANAELDARLARLGPVLSRYPRVFWATLLDAFERMAQVGDVLEGGVSASAEGGVNATDATLTRDSHGPGGQLTASQSPIRMGLTAALAAR